MNKLIKTIIWDVDGTLYQNIPALKPHYDQFRQEYLQKHLPNLSKKERDKQYFDLRKKRQSSTISLATLGSETIDIVGKALDEYIPKQKYLKKDLQLIQLFKDLQQYGVKNFVLRNGTKTNTLEILTWLGLAEINFPDCEFGPFQKVVTAFDMLKIAKPDLRTYQYFLNQLGLKAQTTLSVGDRVKVDLMPASKLGIQTALVWQDLIKPEEKRHVDHVFPTVYEVISLFNQ